MIPLATTTVSVLRVVGADTDSLDPYDEDDPNPPAATTVTSGLRATIGEPAANVALSGGTRVEYTASFVTDPADIQPGDTLTDETGTSWQVLWAYAAPSLGLSHMRGDVRLVTGAT